jgi:hypothetical protein
MPRGAPDIPALFRHRFSVDYSAPFQRHLNRLEVEIGREDYRHLKKVELLATAPSEAQFAAMEEITARLLKTTQNNYNRDLLRRLNIRVYLDSRHYDVYYRLPDRSIRFIAAWRQKVLWRFFGQAPQQDTGWRPAGTRLAGFAARFHPDPAGGVLLLRRQHAHTGNFTLLTATHGPYDPHTFDVALYLLRSGCGTAAVINLGFSGREPLTDENLEKLKGWGIPLNPSNIDVIYPYLDASGHPHCYKLEEGLHRYVALLEGGPPQVIIDVHGCVGTQADDCRLIVGLGAAPPYPRLAALGRLETPDNGLLLAPKQILQSSLSLLRGLSTEISLQFCTGPHRCYHFRVGEEPPFSGRQVDPRTEACSLLAGEPRYFLPAEQTRWLPGAGGNALQRREAAKLRPDALCLHIEIPTAVRRRIALLLRELEIGDSLDASSL